MERSEIEIIDLELLKEYKNKLKILDSKWTKTIAELMAKEYPTINRQGVYAIVSGGNSSQIARRIFLKCAMQYLDKLKKETNDLIKKAS